MKFFTVLFLVGFLLITISIPLSANQTNEIKLPSPVITGGMPLMEALAARNSSREFSEKVLTDQMISNLLWAAFGINRAETGKRTAPSSRNCQDIDVYLSNEEGIYLYDAVNNSLILKIKGDLRKFTGKQDFVEKAPVNLIYVSNLDRIKTDDLQAKLIAGANDTGFIAQNVYLFCASFGLSTVVRAWVDKPVLEKKMNLKENQIITLCQTIGFPIKK